MNSLTIEPLPSNWCNEEYDLAIATIGYEERARYVFEHFQPSAAIKTASGFDSHHVFEYSNNSEWFTSNSFQVADVSDEQFGDWVDEVLRRLERKTSGAKIVVDISSTTRVRMAKLLVALRNALGSSLDVTFVYSLASFNAPPTEIYLNSHVGPVTPEFAGWWEEPDRALVAIVGLGYEQDKALGAVEHLQAAQIWTFTPVSTIEEYSPALLEANRMLLESVPVQQQLQYRVHDPYDCFAKLESLVYGLTRTTNPVLLPFGPKLFSLASLLVALLYPSLPVWRVSAERHEMPINRRASGFVYGIRAIFTGDHPQMRPF